ncbi:hypothetical protein, partial [Pseudomonas viridiflava]|uniref:hypothetical protein n=1 Tax=Pseudomonas viridiflava TaxID=33069 RepID=UPI003D662FD0
YPTVRDAAMPTFESTLDELLSKRRALARDMLSGSGEIKASDYERVLGGHLSPARIYRAFDRRLFGFSRLWRKASCSTRS